MAHVDAVLADEAIVSVVHQALVQRHPQSRRRGRPGFLLRCVLRLLILKHIRNSSYAILEREVRANLVYRDFTRVGAARMPDAKTMGRCGVAIGPTVIHQIHDRSCRSRGPTTLCRDAGCASTPPWWRQRPLSLRQQFIRRSGPGADAHHAEDSQIDWRGWRRAARSQLGAWGFGCWRLSARRAAKLRQVRPR